MSPAALLLLLALSAQDAAPAEEQVLATLPDAVDLEALVLAVAARGDRVAWVAPAADGEGLVLHDGEEVSDAHDFVHAPVISDDGEHLAWVHGDRRSRDRETWRAVHDGKAGRKWDWIGPVALSPDGEDVAYWAAKGAELNRQGFYEGGDYFVVEGRRRHGDYRDAGSMGAPLWSPDGDALAWIATGPRGFLVVVDGEEFGPYLWADQLAWSADGETAAWVAAPSWDSSEQRDPLAGVGSGAPGSGLAPARIHVGENSYGDGWEAVGAPALGGPEGAHLAFVARERDRHTVVHDGEPWTGRWDDLGTPVPSPDGRRVAVAANHGRKQQQVGLAMIDPRWMDGVDVMVWGPDGPQEAGGGGAESACFLVVDDEERPGRWDRVVRPTWSPDGVRVAFRAQREGQWCVVVDGAQSAFYDEVGPPRFTAEALTFWARRDRAVLRVTMPLP